MEPREETGIIQFPVDLNKKEYISYFALFDRVSGAGKRRLIWTGVIAGWLAVEMVLSLLDSPDRLSDALTYGGMLVLCLVCFLVFAPLFRRWQAGKSFDAAVHSGQVFTGTFTLTEQKAEKVTPSVRSEMPLTGETLFVETEAMQCFLNRNSRAIVLPARCLTKEDAEAVRTFATATLPPQNCRQEKSVKAERTTRLTIEEKPETPPLMEISVSYRQEELKRLMKTLFSRAFFATFMVYLPFAFLAALMLGLTRGFLTGAIAFWVIVVGICLLLWLGLRRKYPIKVEDLPPFSFELRFTEEALTVDGGSENGKAIIRWELLSHAVESEEAVEFYNRRQYVYVPKRCIEDMELCRRIVDDCRHPNGERKGTKK